MLVFLFKSMVCLALLFGLYKVLLGRTTLFRANHATLIIITLLAIAMPLITVSVGEKATVVGSVDQIMSETEYLQLLLAMNADSQAAEQPASQLFTWQNVLALVYLLGVLFCMVQIIRSAVANVLFIRRTPAWKKEKNYTLLLTDDETVSPYSLGRYVVMSRMDYEQNGEAILAHELCHVSRHHTLSVMLMNILSAVLWLNPLVWLVREELLLVCEYEADTAVITKGIDAKKYQLLLIRKAVSPSRYTIANSLNHSSLKKRIIMMKKSNSTIWARLRYPCIALAAAAILPAFAHKDLISPIEETLKENLVEEIRSEILSTPAEMGLTDQEIGGKGTLISENEQIAEAENKEFLPADTARTQYHAVLTAGESDPTVTKVISTTKVVTVQPGETPPEVGITEYRFAADKSPLVLLDGKEVNMDDVNKEDIATINVLKNPDALKQYGEKGKNGVLLITSRKPGEPYSQAMKLPEFEGGPGAMMKYIADNMRYPEKAIKENKEGRVIVQFVVTKTGAIEDARVVRGVSEELDAEAIRVVQSTNGKWNPGKNESGETINCKYTLPFVFRLPEQTK